MPVQHATSEKKWELLLKTIGAREVQVTNVTDSKITIKIDPENLEYLRKLLDSKDTLKKNTLHALFCDNQNADQKSSNGTHHLNTDNINIKDNEWFKKVVSDEFITQNNLTDVFNNMKVKSQYNEELLTTQVQFTIPDIIPYLNFRLKLTKLQSAITDEDILAKILAGEEPLIAAHNKASPTRFARIISKIVSDEDNCTIDFVINNGAFAQTLQAYKGDGNKSPIIASDLKGLFIIDKQYLLKYLSPIFNGLIWSEKEKVPIVFHAEEPKSPSNIISHDFNVVIDTSGSMDSNFAVYIDNIKTIIDKLGKIPNWNINIVRFSDDSEKRSFFLNNHNTTEQIKGHIGTFVASGGTRLYCTVQEVLNQINTKLRNTPNLYSTLLVFTDGDNNDNRCTENDVINAAANLKAIPQFNMYAVGFGETESAFQKFFKRIADFGGFVHIKLDDPNGMAQLQQYISTIAQKINVWEILQGELKLSVARVPEGDAFILDMQNQGNPIDINGISFMRNNKDKFTIGTEIVCSTN